MCWKSSFCVFSSTEKKFFMSSACVLCVVFKRETQLRRRNQKGHGAAESISSVVLCTYNSIKSPSPKFIYIYIDFSGFFLLFFHIKNCVIIHLAGRIVRMHGVKFDFLYSFLCVCYPSKKFLNKNQGEKMTIFFCQSPARSRTGFCNFFNSIDTLLKKNLNKEHGIHILLSNQLFCWHFQVVGFCKIKNFKKKTIFEDHTWPNDCKN